MFIRHRFSLLAVFTPDEIRPLFVYTFLLPLPHQPDYLRTSNGPFHLDSLQLRPIATFSEQDFNLHSL